jgi:hypothetical protein
MPEAVLIFRRVRKIARSFVQSVRPFVRVGQIGFKWMDFHELLLSWVIFEKSVGKIQD